MKRFASVVFGVLSAALVAGCPGTLSNPDAFVDAGVVPKEAQEVFEESCATAGCHDDVTSAANLDLLSPNVESRVVGVSSAEPACQSRVLVVAGDPEGSYLLDKVLGTIGICNSRMPLLGVLSDSDTDVLRQWIIDLGDSGAGSPDGG